MVSVQFPRARRPPRRRRARTRRGGRGRRRRAGCRGMSAEMRISEVLIISMFTPAEASALAERRGDARGGCACRRRRASPCRRARRRGPPRGRPRPARRPGPRHALGPVLDDSVKVMSVLPVCRCETFCSTMSMSISASATTRKMRAAKPGWSGTPITVTLASDRSCATPVRIGLFHGEGPRSTRRSIVPGLSLYDERTCSGHAVATGVLDARSVQHLRPARGHLEHLLVGDGLEQLGVRHDARVGGVDAVDVGVDLADVGPHGRGHRDRGGVRAAAAERGDLLGVRADALEARDERDVRPRRGRRGCARASRR